MLSLIYGRIPARVLYVLIVALLVASAAVVMGRADAAGAGNCDGQLDSHDAGCTYAGGRLYEVFNETAAVALYTDNGEKVDLGGVLTYPDSLAVAVLNDTVYVFANGTDGLYYRAAPAGTLDFGPWTKFAGK